MYRGMYYIRKIYPMVFLHATLFRRIISIAPLNNWHIRDH